MSAIAQLRRLPLRAKVWRLAVAAGCLAFLAAGQLADTDDYFPFGRLSQYASAHDLDGRVRSTYLVADNTTGERVPVPLNADGVGIGRAEIEGQLGRIIDDPSLLQGIAEAWAARHPQRPEYETLYLLRDTYDLVDGRPSGERETVELARWLVE